MRACVLFFCFLLSFCANAQTVNTKIIKIDENYTLVIDCDMEAETRTFHLVRQNVNVFSLKDETIQLSVESPEEYEQVAKKCINHVMYDSNFNGNGLNVIYVSPENMTMVRVPWHTLYIVDTKLETIKLAGDLPVDVDTLKDGSFLFEEYEAYGKMRAIYSIENDKIIVKKNTWLIFDGEVCITNEENGVKNVHFLCEGGTVATKKKPVCIEQKFREQPNIIPLRQCDIKKKEIWIWQKGK